MASGMRGYIVTTKLKNSDAMEIGIITGHRSGMNYEVRLVSGDRDRVMVYLYSVHALNITKTMRMLGKEPYVREIENLTKAEVKAYESIIKQALAMTKTLEMLNDNASIKPNYRACGKSATFGMRYGTSSQNISRIKQQI